MIFHGDRIELSRLAKLRVSTMLMLTIPIHSLSGMVSSLISEKSESKPVQLALEFLMITVRNPAEISFAVSWYPSCSKPGNFGDS